jgi:hypothetical protein
MVYTCHCTDCQRTSSAFSMALVLEAEGPSASFEASQKRSSALLIAGVCAARLGPLPARHEIEEHPHRAPGSCSAHSDMGSMPQVYVALPEVHRCAVRDEVKSRLSSFESNGRLIMSVEMLIGIGRA